jgi:hypothetical protein
MDGLFPFPSIEIPTKALIFMGMAPLVQIVIVDLSTSYRYTFVGEASNHEMR